VTVLEDSGAAKIAGWLQAASPGPENEARQKVSFLVTSDNPKLFVKKPAISPDGTLTFTPAKNANGTATVTVVAKDNGGTAKGGRNTSEPQTFRILVTAVNDAPSFAKGKNLSVKDDAGAQTIVNWAKKIQAGPADEADQSLTFFVQEIVNADLFSGKPAISPDGTLTFTPAAGAAGKATITVVLQDGGGTENGGTDTSSAQTFTITITPSRNAISSENTSPGASTLATNDAAILAILADRDAEDSALRISSPSLPMPFGRTRSGPVRPDLLPLAP
jgi:hypothetical protein